METHAASPRDRPHDAPQDPLPFPMVELDEHGVISWATPAFAELVDAPAPDRLVRHHFAETLRDPSDFTVWWRQCQQTGGINNIRMSMSGRGGKKVQVTADASVLPEGHTMLVFHPTPPTIAKERDALAPSGMDEWRRALVAAADEAALGLLVLGVGDDDRPATLFATEGACKILGTPRSTLMEERPVLLDTVRRHYATRKTGKDGEAADTEGSLPPHWHFKVHHKRPDDQTIWLEGGVASGEFWGRQATFIFFRDVTEAVKTEIRQHQQFRLLQQIIQSAPVQILQVDEDGGMRLLAGAGSRRMETFLSEDDGQTLSDLPLSVQQIVRAAMEGAQNHTIVTRGDTVMEVTAAPLGGPRVKGAVVVVSDISGPIRHERAEREIERRSNQLRQAEQMQAWQKALINRFAHELFTPMTSVKATVGALTARTEGDEKMARVSRNLDRMQEVIENILKASKDPAAVQVGDADPGALRTIIDGVVEERRPGLSRAGTDMHVGTIPDVEVTTASALTAAMQKAITLAVETRPCDRIQVDAETTSDQVQIGMTISHDGKEQASSDPPDPAGMATLSDNDLADVRHVLAESGGWAWTEDGSPGQQQLFIQVPAARTGKGAKGRKTRGPRQAEGRGAPPERGQDRAPDS